jgi:hypothetical protein
LVFYDELTIPLFVIRRDDPLKRHSFGRIITATHAGKRNLIAVTFHHQRKETNETSNPLSKSVALSQELQTKSCNSNPTWREAEPRVPPIARWSDHDGQRGLFGLKNSKGVLTSAFRFNFTVL